MTELIDIGVNLTHDSFDVDRDAVIDRARAAGVSRMIVTGTTVTASAQALELAETRPGVLYATAGVHPHHADELDNHAIEALRRLLANQRVVAVGECGLDYFRDFSPRNAQRRAFEAQLALAAEIGKPVFLHQRDAHDDFVEILSAHRGALGAGVAHCFTGGNEALAALLELELYIGITGWICDERRAAELVGAVADVPLDRLLIETDAPYLLPRNLSPRPKSRRNEPCYLVNVLDRIGSITGLDREEIAAATTRNAERLFGLMPGA